MVRFEIWDAVMVRLAMSAATIVPSAIFALVSVLFAICAAVIVLPAMLSAAMVADAIWSPVMLALAISVAVIVPLVMLSAVIVPDAILDPVIVADAICVAVIVPLMMFAAAIVPLAMSSPTMVPSTMLFDTIVAAAMLVPRIVPDAISPATMVAAAIFDESTASAAIFAFVTAAAASSKAEIAEAGRSSLPAAITKLAASIEDGSSCPALRPDDAVMVWTVDSVQLPSVPLLFFPATRTFAYCVAAGRSQKSVWIVSCAGLMPAIGIQSESGVVSPTSFQKRACASYQSVEPGEAFAVTVTVKPNFGTPLSDLLLIESPTLAGAGGVAVGVSAAAVDSTHEVTSPFQLFARTRTLTH